MNICKKCHDLDGDLDLQARVKQTIERLDPDIRCSQSVYSQRLAICESCHMMVNGMCGYCGCFVLIRGAKAVMGCPNPGEDQWQHCQEYRDN